jgi:basic membrane lipoprotein Med (substrate-binding protein (PBP1-ABC) superfamily)
VKRVDRGIYLAIKGAENGQFKGGSNLTFNLANGGVAVGKISPKVPTAFRKQIEKLGKQIVAGKVKVPTKVS